MTGYDRAQQPSPAPPFASAGGLWRWGVREDMGTRWIILRTAGRSTLTLAASLAEDGFEVWTPVETKIERVPKMTARHTVQQAIMPSYLFARAVHLVDLLQLAGMPVKPRRGAGMSKPAHAAFSVLHAFGGIPAIDDRHFAHLRKLEARRTPRRLAEYAFPRAKQVKVTGGICGGMIGVVVRSTPAKTVLHVMGGRKLEIPTSLLELNEVGDARPSLAKAA